MKRLFLTVAALSLSAGLASAQGEFDINKTINETNFLVSNGCSGTLISKAHRLILTNYHCIDRYVSVRSEERTSPDGTVKRVKVEKLRDVDIGQRDYNGHDKVGSVTYTTRIVAKRKKSDLALLQLKGEKLRSAMYSPVLPSGRKVTRGDTVWAVGNPFGFDATVTKGIISNTTRKLQVPWADGESLAFYQIDATIAPGNSGGALYSTDGHLIGVPAAGIPGVLGLAINTETIRNFLDMNCYSVAHNPSAEDPATCKLNKSLEKCAQAKNKEACVAKTKRDAADKK